LDIFQDALTRDFAYETIAQTDLKVAGPLYLKRTCPDCGLMFIARLPIVSESNQIKLLDGTLVNRWGFVATLLSWDEIVAETNLYVKMKGRGYAFQLIRTGEKTVEIATSDDFDPELEPVASETFETANGFWDLHIQTDHSSKEALVVSVAVIGSFFMHSWYTPFWCKSKCTWPCVARTWHRLPRSTWSAT